MKGLGDNNHQKALSHITLRKIVPIYNKGVLLVSRPNMAKVSNEPLQPNPFLTYRDPQTGLWIVVQDNPILNGENKSSPHPGERKKKYLRNSA